MREIGKIFSFEAAHKLPFHRGACQNLHGHSYRLEVRISGKVIYNKSQPDQGMIMDFSQLKGIVREAAIDSYDHSLLNNHFHNPTAELMVEEIADAIKQKLPKRVQLTMVKLWETEDNYAIWRNENL